MKKFTFLLFALSLLINAGFAQRLNPVQKVTINNHKAQEMIPCLNMADPLNTINFSLAYFNSPEKRLKSAAMLKLDSVVISTRSSITDQWIKINKQIFVYDYELVVMR